MNTKKIKTYSYVSIEDAYKRSFRLFLKTAQKNLLVPEDAADVVHDSLARTMEFVDKNPTKKIQSFVIVTNILRKCKAKNKEVEILTSLDSNEYVSESSKDGRVRQRLDREYHEQSY